MTPAFCHEFTPEEAKEIREMLKWWRENTQNSTTKLPTQKKSDPVRSSIASEWKEIDTIDLEGKWKAYGKGEWIFKDSFFGNERELTWVMGRTVRKGIYKTTSNGTINKLIFTYFDGDEKYFLDFFLTVVDDDRINLIIKRKDEDWKAILKRK
jgi:hypothetical protein